MSDAEGRGLHCDHFDPDHPNPHLPAGVARVSFLLGAKALGGEHPVGQDTPDVEPERERHRDRGRGNSK
jgi:hypothetical protein